MSKPHALVLLVIKLLLIAMLLVYCTAWPGHDDFGTVENISVLTVILATGIAFILEALAFRTLTLKEQKGIYWLLAAHMLTVALTIIQAVCVFLYSQISSKNYRHLQAALQWTSASDPSLIMTAKLFVKSISVAVALLSLATGVQLCEWKRKLGTKTDLSEICTTAYLETNPDSEQVVTTGMHGTPYL